MINVLHLLWIVPLSMMFGAATLIGFSAVAIGSTTIEEEEEIERYIKERKNDNRNA